MINKREIIRNIIFAFLMVTTILIGIRLSALNHPVFADDLVTEDGLFNYSVNEANTEITITKYIGEITNVVIPEKINDIPVTTIGEYAFSYKSVSGITIPTSVKTIEQYAFCGCEFLKNIVLPNSVTDLGNGAFIICGNLESATLSNQLKTISSNCFERCNKLKNITIPDRVTSIGANAFYGCDSLKSVVLPNSVTDLGNNAFYECTHLENVTLSNQLKTIGAQAFDKCKAISSLQIPDSVTTVGLYAFAYMTSLKTIKLPGGLETLSRSLFSNSGLTEITIPKTVKEIDSQCFSFCNYLERIIVEEGNTVYDSRNNCNAIIDTKTNTLIIGCTKSTIPYSVVAIGDRAFRGCKGLTEIILPNTVTTIGNESFSKCSGLTKLVLPKSLEKLGDEAFSYCSSLTKVTIQEGLETIGNGAFTWDEQLQSIDIPKSVSKIGEYAFYNCLSLTKVSLSDNIEILDDLVFGNTGLTEITIPKSVIWISNSCFSGCSSLCKISVSAENLHYDSRGNCNAIIDTINNSLVKGSLTTKIPNTVTSIGDDAFNYLENLTSIVIPDSVTSIGDQAFNSCTNLSSVVFSKNLQTLGHNAFSSCKSLSEITLPAGLTQIERDAFFNCTGLKKIVIPNTVTTIGAYAFGGCSALTSVQLPDQLENLEACTFMRCSSLKSIVIPGVREIGKSAFAKCSNLETVTIQYGVTSISEYAFEECGKLKEIVIPDSMEYSGAIDITAFFACSSLEKITTPCFIDTAYLLIPSTCETIHTHIYSDCEFGTVHNVAQVNVDGESDCDGDMTARCMNCSGSGDAIIYRPDTISLAVDKVYYEGGNACEPEVIVKDTNGNVIQKIMYNVVYSNNNDIGTGTIKVEFIESAIGRLYKGSLETSFEIVDAKTDFQYSTYTENGSTYASVKYIGTASKVTIPKYIDGYLVKKIDTNCFSNKSVTSVYIPDTITEIGDYAFAYCTDLKEINISKNVSKISDTAFIGNDLESITVDSDNPTYTTCGNFFEPVNAIIQKENKTLVVGCKNSSFNADIVKIADYAFYDCKGLSKIELSGNVTTIGEYSFYGCESLENVYIPGSVNHIGTYAFAKCPNVFKISVDENNEYYASGSEDSYLYDKVNKVLIKGANQMIYEIPEETVRIADEAFLCNALRVIYIPSGVTEIGNAAFKACTGLLSISLPDSVTIIGNNAFNENTNICVSAENRVAAMKTLSGYSKVGVCHHHGNIGAAWTCMNKATCEKCGIQYGEYRDHNYSIEWSTSATEHFHKCLRDNCNSTSENTKHNYTKLTTTKKATQDTDGYQIFACLCGVTNKVLIYHPKTVTVTDSLVYTGSSQKPVPVIKDSSGKVMDSKLYTFEYYNKAGQKVTPINVGEYYINIIFSPTYYDNVTKKVSYKIVAQTGAKATISYTSKAYTGKILKPTVTVKSKAGKILKLNTDYTVTILTAAGKKTTKPVAAGTYKVRIVLKGNYSGTITKTYKIAAQTGAKATISYTSKAYTGKILKPTVTVKSKAGKKLKLNTDYTVTLLTAAGKKTTKPVAAGIYKVRIVLKGNYSGTITKTYRITPKVTTIESLTNQKAKKLIVKWNKNSQASGYVIQYATNKGFKKAKTIVIKTNKLAKPSKTLTKLTIGSTYYVRIRAYKLVGKVKVYASWSTAKTVKITQ